MQYRLEPSQLKKHLHDQARQGGKPGHPPGGEVDDDGEEKQGEEERVQAFRSADEIYRSIPQELSPRREGWDVLLEAKSK